MTTTRNAPISAEGFLEPIDRVSIWFRLGASLRWFAFVPRRDAVFIATRLRVMFGVCAAVLPYDFEPASWQRPLGGERTGKR